MLMISSLPIGEEFLKTSENDDRLNCFRNDRIVAATAEESIPPATATFARAARPINGFGRIGVGICHKLVDEKAHCRKIVAAAVWLRIPAGLGTRQTAARGLAINVASLLWEWTD